jgi:hypothetical protein
MRIVLLIYRNSKTDRVGTYLHNGITNKSVVFAAFLCGYDVKTVAEFEKSSVINHIITSLFDFNTTILIFQEKNNTKIKRAR